MEEPPREETLTSLFLAICKEVYRTFRRLLYNEENKPNNDIQSGEETNKEQEPEIIETKRKSVEERESSSKCTKSTRSYPTMEFLGAIIQVSGICGIFHVAGNNRIKIPILSEHKEAAQTELKIKSLDNLTWCPKSEKLQRVRSEVTITESGITVGSIRISAQIGNEGRDCVWELEIKRTAEGIEAEITFKE